MILESVWFQTAIYFLIPSYSTLSPGNWRISLQNGGRGGGFSRITLLKVRAYLHTNQWILLAVGMDSRQVTVYRLDR